MGNHYQAQIAKFSAYISNGTTTLRIPAMTAKFRHMINQLPIVEVTAQLDNARIKNLGLDIEQFTKIAADTQHYLINKLRLNVDFEVLAMDGQGSPLSFRGFMSNPVFTIQPGLVVLTYTGVHKMSGLQGFNMNIYDISTYYGHTAQNQLANAPAAAAATQADITSLLEDAQNTTASDNIENKLFPTAFTSGPASISDRLNSLIAITMNLFTSKYLPSAGLSDLQSIHNMNKVIYTTFVQPFLTSANSLAGTTLPGLVPTTAKATLPLAYMTDVLDNELRRVLFSSEHFAGSLPELCNMFRFQLNANWTGDAWLEPLQMYSDPQKKMIKAPLQAIAFNVANTFELPLLKIYMIVPQGDAYGFQTLTPGISPAWSVASVAQSAAMVQAVNEGNTELQATILSTMPNLAVYPQISSKPTDMGVFYIVSPPTWIAPESTYVGNLEHTVVASPLDLADATVGMGRLMEQNQISDGLKKTLMQQMLEDTFNEWFLGSSGATLTLPFCAPLQVGYTYNVQDITNGALIFTGYLAAVSHTISQGAGSQSSLQTDCVFSHIKMSGVQFEGISAEGAVPATIPAELTIASDLSKEQTAP